MDTAGEGRYLRGRETGMAQRSAYHHGDLERALVDEAWRMVRDQGAESFSLRAAARAVGVDPAAAYRHFPNKAALLARVAARSLAALTVRMEQATAEVEEPVERLRGIGHAYVRFAIEEPELFRLAFGPHGSAGTEPVAFEPSGRSPSLILAAVLTELHEAGQVAHPPERTSVSTWSVVHGLATLAVSGNLSCDPLDPVVDQVLDALLYGLLSGH